MFWGGSSYFSDKVFDQHGWHDWAFGSLRDDGDFADVTLACEDDELKEAHKVVPALTNPSSKSNHLPNLPF